MSAPAYLLTDKQKLERDARSGVIAALTCLQAQSHCSQEAALTTLLTSARAGKLDTYTDKILRQARDSRGRAGDGYPFGTHPQALAWFRRSDAKGAAERHARAGLGQGLSGPLPGAAETIRQRGLP